MEGQDTSVQATLGVVLFGGGESRRMGCCKLLLPWGTETIWQRALSVVQSWPGPVQAVVNMAYPTLAEVAALRDVVVTPNTKAHLGKAHSVQLALAHWAETGVLSSLRGIVCLCADQPFFTRQMLETVGDTFGRAYDHFGDRAIVCSTYAGVRGNPVVFGAHWFSALASLSGDEGGRGILRGDGQASTVFVELDPRAGIDIDTPAVYAEWHAQYLAEVARETQKGDV